MDEARSKMDIEKIVTIETKCNSLMESMFRPVPRGPGGDTWEPANKDDSVDFVKFEKPVKICGCILREKREESLHGVATDFKKRHVCGCLDKSKNKNLSPRDRYLRQLLDSIRPSQTWKTNTGIWRKHVLSEPIKRKEVLQMNELLNYHLKKNLAQEKGVCPERRHLFNSLFDELIRQEMIISPDGGLLLMRVRDELKMSMASYEALYEQGLNYGMQKRWTGELLLGPLNKEFDKLSNQVIEINKELQSLNDCFQERGVKCESTLAAIRDKGDAVLQQIQEINAELQIQLNDLIPEIELIERERRMKLL